MDKVVAYRVGKMFANYTFYTKSKMYKEHKKLTLRKQITQCKNKVSKEDTRMAEEHLEKCSTSLVIREMHIKTTLRFHIGLVRMAKINKTNDSSC